MGDAGVTGAVAGRSTARRARTATHGGRAALRGALLAIVATVLASCGLTSTTELGGGSAPDGYPVQAPDGYPAQDIGADGAVPQVMPEVTLPDGSVATVPQASVPVAVLPTVAPTASPPSGVPVTAAPTSTGAVHRLSSERLVQVAANALGQVRFDWQAALPGWQLRFLPGRSGIRGATFPDSYVIEVYVRTSDSVSDLAHVIAHEMGHAVDVTRLTDAERAVWKTARGEPASAQWFPSGSGSPDLATPAGDWAESFARWRIGSGWYSKVGPPPTAAQFALMAGLTGLS